MIFFNGCQKATFLPQVWSNCPTATGFAGGPQAKGPSCPPISGALTSCSARYRVPNGRKTAAEAEHGPPSRSLAPSMTAASSATLPEGLPPARRSARACFVRQRVDGQMVLTTYGRSSGLCIDPIEKKPLN